MKKIFVFLFASLLAIVGTLQAQVRVPDCDNQENNIIKFSFLPPLLGSTSFSYERALNPKLGWEVEAGIIGLSFGKGFEDKRSMGGSLSIGMKFHTANKSSGHILAGTYLKPELAISLFKRYYYDYVPYYYNYWGGYDYHDVERKEFVTAVALMLTFGKQVIYKSNLTLDWFASLGYSYRSDGDGGFNYNFIGGGEEFPIAFSAGLKIGYAFGNKKSQVINR
ncbi:MAG: hypothetical protein LBO06_01940 [Bacteroidales bacterium]|nr:hypothetical protein [Bacteroidales bacterium]